MSDARVLQLLGPEGVSLPLEVATVAERLVAFIIDQAIILLVTVVIAIPLVIAFGTGSDFLAGFFLVGLFLFRYFYFAVLEGFRHGTTWGKRAMELRVISLDGDRLRGDAVIARNLMRELETMVPLVAILAPESMIGRAPAWMTIPALAWVVAVAFLPFITKNRSRAGDLVGGTVVVRVPKASLLREQGAQRESFGPIVFQTRHLVVYGEHELETLAVILRDDELDRVPLDDLRLVAGTIARKIQYLGPEPNFDPKRFLRAFYVQQRAALEDKLVFGRRKKDKFDES